MHESTATNLYDFMHCNTMMKVGPSFYTSGTSWDHQGKTDISQIFISWSGGRIGSIHIAYVEDGGKKIVLSDKIGGVATGTSMETITVDYPAEYLTRIRGWYDSSLGLSNKYLASITFETNIDTYGPYPPVGPKKFYDVVHFNYQIGGKFCGFYGTQLSDGIESMGFYMKPIDKLAKKQGADRPLLLPKLEYPSASRR